MLKEFDTKRSSALTLGNIRIRMRARWLLQSWGQCEDLEKLFGSRCTPASVGVGGGERE